MSKDATELKVDVDQMKTNVRDTSEQIAIRKGKFLTDASLLS
jgi:hypothetical protein